MKKYLYFAAAAALFFSSCSGGNSYELKKEYTDKPARGDILIEGSIGEPSTLNPVLASDSASHDITGLIFNGLVKYDKALKLTGELAKSWNISNDGLVITFKLRKNIKFHDGVEFTSKDVKFTYEKYVDPSVKTAYRSLFELVDRVETPDKYTVKVYYKKPYAPALETWTASVIPAHIYGEGDFNKSPYNRKPTGTGPYVFKEWATADKIVLEANPAYFEGEPYISGYIYRVIPDMSVMFMELASGSIDMMGLTSDLYLGKASEKPFGQRFNKFKYPSFSYTYIGYNMERDLFKDARVRKALCYAIDTKTIIQGVRGGLAEPATGPFIPGSWAYNEEVEPYPYDTQKAAKLLSECGWKRNKKGILEKNGRKFKFTLMTNNGNKEREQIATIAQEQFGKLGIKVNIKIIEWNVFLSQYIDRKDFDAVVMGWSLSRDPDCYDIWHSSKNREGQFNFVSYKNKEVDRLLEEGRTTFNREKRAGIYKKIHKIIADEAPYTFLYNAYSLPAVHKRIHNIKPEAAGISYNFTKWYVPKELQKYKVY